MFYTFDYILNWIITLTYGTLLFRIIGRFLSFRWKYRPIQFLYIIIFSSCCNVVVYPEEITGTLGFFLCLILLLLLCYRDKWYLKLSVSIVLFPIIAAVNYVTQDVGALIWMHLFHRTTNELASTILHTLTMSLRIPFWYFVYREVRKWIGTQSRELTGKMWFILDMISLTSFIGIISVVYQSTSYDSYIAYPTCIACVVTSLGCCYLLTFMTRAARADLELQTFQYQQTYYQQLEENQNTVRKLRHDMKNHLNIIGSFLHEQAPEKAEAYLLNLNQEFNVSAKAYCKNSIINAVLNSKEQLAKDAEIACDFRIDLSESPAIEDIDLCSLFANTLDNAIEACRLVPRIAARTMTVKARCKNRFFSYQVENTKGHEILTENGRIKTSKADPRGHGIGLSNIRHIVEKYNGDLKIDYDETRFTVTVLITF